MPFGQTGSHSNPSSVFLQLLSAIHRKRNPTPNQEQANHRPFSIMECPILVWMLSLNRDVTTEVCICVLCAPLLFDFFDGSCPVIPFVQEYDKCFHLVRECSPHARITYDCTSIESFRKFLLCTALVFTSTSHPLPFVLSRSCPRHVARGCTCRPNHITNVATPHDAPQTDIKNKVEGLRDIKREALDRAGLSVQLSSSFTPHPIAKISSPSLPCLVPAPYPVPSHPFPSSYHA